MQSAEESIPYEEAYMPVFYVGHHESKRDLPITQFVLRQAQDVGYDMLTTPITTPHFQSRVLALLSSHLSLEDDSNESTPAPIISPFMAVDTPLTPGDIVSQLVGYSSPWVDLCSPDPLIANISRQVLNMEIAYAAFCGVANIIIPGPRKHDNSRDTVDGLTQYARAVQEVLGVGVYMNVAIHLPMYQGTEIMMKEPIGDLAPFAREQYLSGSPDEDVENDLFGSWDSWNIIRSMCRYSSRLSVALALPRQLPEESLQSRWFAEPLRLLTFNPNTFLTNKGGHPVLGKAHQALITRYMKLKHSPWLLLCDVGPIPFLDDPNALMSTADGHASPSAVASPTPAEAAEQLKTGSVKVKSKDKGEQSHLIYIRWLQRNQPARSTIERFGQGYQDYLQAPLQPLTDNLESVTYEVFEKDPVKYDWYEEAVVQALTDWKQQKKPTSNPDGRVVVAVAGSGRGPLVTRALRASARTGVPVEAWAVEKNPNAYVLLQRRNEEAEWNGQVNVVKSDMRAWKGPLRSNADDSGPIYGKVDILISELLGSFADNELSPECLDGVQHVIAPEHGISIPSSYTAHLTPISAPRIHADIAHRSPSDDTAADTPYVVLLHQIDYLATTVPKHHRFQCAWEFTHPVSKSTIKIAEARRGGGVSGGGGGSMAGGDGANEHNVRYSRTKFVCKDRGVMHGIAGYFESVLYDGGAAGVCDGKVELSTRPDTIDAKSKDMISWFPIYFPLKDPLYFPDDAELEISMWRQTNDRKVWYEWIVDAFVMVGPGKRVRVGTSELGSSRKQGCLM